jgi:hypothetical protein
VPRATTAASRARDAAAPAAFSVVDRAREDQEGEHSLEALAEEGVVDGVGHAEEGERGRGAQSRGDDEDEDEDEYRIARASMQVLSTPTSYAGLPRPSPAGLQELRQPVPSWNLRASDSEPSGGTSTRSSSSSSSVIGCGTKRERERRERALLPGPHDPARDGVPGSDSSDSSGASAPTRTGFAAEGTTVQDVLPRLVQTRTLRHRRDPGRERSSSASSPVRADPPKRRRVLRRRSKRSQGSAASSSDSSSSEAASPSRFPPLPTAAPAPQPTVAARVTIVDSISRGLRQQRLGGLPAHIWARHSSPASTCIFPPWAHVSRSKLDPQTTAATDVDSIGLVQPFVLASRHQGHRDAGSLLGVLADMLFEGNTSSLHTAHVAALDPDSTPTKNLRNVGFSILPLYGRHAAAGGTTSTTGTTGARAAPTGRTATSGTQSRREPRSRAAGARSAARSDQEGADATAEEEEEEETEGSDEEEDEGEEHGHVVGYVGTFAGNRAAQAARLPLPRTVRGLTALRSARTTRAVRWTAVELLRIRSVPDVHLHLAIPFTAQAKAEFASPDVVTVGAVAFLPGAGTRGSGSGLPPTSEPIRPVTLRALMHHMALDALQNAVYRAFHFASILGLHEATARLYPLDRGHSISLQASLEQLGTLLHIMSLDDAASPGLRAPAVRSAVFRESFLVAVVHGLKNTALPLRLDAIAQRHAHGQHAAASHAPHLRRTRSESLDDPPPIIFPTRLQHTPQAAPAPSFTHPALSTPPSRAPTSTADPSGTRVPAEHYLADADFARFVASGRSTDLLPATLPIDCLWPSQLQILRPQAPLRAEWLRAFHANTQTPTARQSSQSPRPWESASTANAPTAGATARRDDPLQPARQGALADDASRAQRALAADEDARERDALRSILDDCGVAVAAVAAVTPPKTSDELLDAFEDALRDAEGAFGTPTRTAGSAASSTTHILLHVAIEHAASDAGSFLPRSPFPATTAVFPDLCSSLLVLRAAQALADSFLSVNSFSLEGLRRFSGWKFQHEPVGQRRASVTIADASATIDFLARSPISTLASARMVRLLALAQGAKFYAQSARGAGTRAIPHTLDLLHSGTEARDFLTALASLRSGPHHHSRRFDSAAVETALCRVARWAVARHDRWTFGAGLRVEAHLAGWRTCLLGARDLQALAQPPSAANPGPHDAFVRAGVALAASSRFVQEIHSWRLQRVDDALRAACVALDVINREIGAFGRASDPPLRTLAASIALLFQLADGTGSGTRDGYIRAKPLAPLLASVNRFTVRTGSPAVPPHPDRLLAPFFQDNRSPPGTPSPLPTPPPRRAHAAGSAAASSPSPHRLGVVESLLLEAEDGAGNDSGAEVHVRLRPGRSPLARARTVAAAASGEATGSASLLHSLVEDFRDAQLPPATGAAFLGGLVLFAWTIRFVTAIGGYFTWRSAYPTRNGASNDSEGFFLDRLAFRFSSGQPHSFALPHPVSGFADSSPRDTLNDAQAFLHQIAAAVAQSNLLPLAFSVATSADPHLDLIVSAPLNSVVDVLASQILETTTILEALHTEPRPRTLLELRNAIQDSSGAADDMTAVLFSDATSAARSSPPPTLLCSLVRLASSGACLGGRHTNSGSLPSQNLALCLRAAIAAFGWSHCPLVDSRLVLTGSPHARSVRTARDTSRTTPPTLIGTAMIAEMLSAHVNPPGASLPPGLLPPTADNHVRLYHPLVPLPPFPLERNGTSSWTQTAGRTVFSIAVALLHASVVEGTPPPPSSSLGLVWRLRRSSRTWLTTKHPSPAASVPEASSPPRFLPPPTLVLSAFLHSPPSLDDPETPIPALLAASSLGHALLHANPRTSTSSTSASSPARPTFPLPRTLDLFLRLLPHPLLSNSYRWTARSSQASCPWPSLPPAVQLLNSTEPTAVEARLTAFQQLTLSSLAGCLASTSSPPRSLSPARPSPHQLFLVANPPSSSRVFRVSRRIVNMLRYLSRLRPERPAPPPQRRAVALLQDARVQSAEEGGVGNSSVTPGAMDPPPSQATHDSASDPLSTRRRSTASASRAAARGTLSRSAAAQTPSSITPPPTSRTPTPHASAAAAAPPHSAPPSRLDPSQTSRTQNTMEESDPRRACTCPREPSCP